MTNLQITIPDGHAVLLHKIAERRGGCALSNVAREYLLLGLLHSAQDELNLLPEPEVPMDF